MSDTSKHPSVEVVTRIYGPSAEELRKPFSKSIGQIAKELQQQQAAPDVFQIQRKEKK
jgi:hypothetical protein